MNFQMIELSQTDFKEQMQQDENSALHREIAVILQNDQKKILLQKRSAQKKSNPNKWALLHGHVESGEGFVEAALRECQEELGIIKTPQDLRPFARLFQKEVHIVYFFLASCNSLPEQFILQEEEVDEVKWFSLDEVISMLQSHDETLVYHSDKLPLFEALKELNE